VNQKLRDNGLSITLLGLFLIIQVGLSLVGQRQYNQEQADHGRPAITYLEYVRSPAFLEATMENWESEFLQMFAYVLLTAFLFQKGSAESKDPQKQEAVDRDPRQSCNDKTAPWPVRKGGIVLKLYENSLSIALFLLFVISFVLHAIGGAKEYSQQQTMHGEEAVTVVQYLGTAQFWFESLQNWQSEFFSIGVLVLLSIFLRQKGSPESKPVDSPHNMTGHE
jgi:preprotein translocase subunit SecG